MHTGIGTPRAHGLDGMPKVGCQSAFELTLNGAETRILLLGKPRIRGAVIGKRENE